MKQEKQWVMVRVEQSTHKELSYLSNIHQVSNSKYISDLMAQNKYKSQVINMLKKQLPAKKQAEMTWSFEIEKQNKIENLKFEIIEQSKICKQKIEAGEKLGYHLRKDLDDIAKMERELLNLVLGGEELSIINLIKNKKLTKGEK